MKDVEITDFHPSDKNNVRERAPPAVGVLSIVAFHLKISVSSFCHHVRSISPLWTSKYSQSSKTLGMFLVLESQSAAVTGEDPLVEEALLVEEVLLVVVSLMETPDEAYTGQDE